MQQMRSQEAQVHRWQSTADMVLNSDTKRYVVTLQKKYRMLEHIYLIAFHLNQAK